MVKIFNRSTALQLAVILAAMLLLWGQALTHPTAATAGDGSAPLYSLATAWTGAAPLAGVLLTMGLVMAEGIGLNLLLADAGLVPKHSLLPTLLYCATMSAPATTLAPAVFVNGGLILFVKYLLLHKTPLTIGTERVCGATAMIGVCTMFYLPAAALLLSYLLVAVSYRLYGWRDWAAMLLGLLAPYVALGTVLWVAGGLESWVADTVEAMGCLRPRIGHADAAPLAGGIAMGMIVVASLAHVAEKLKEKPVIWQKNALSVALCAVGAAGATALGQVVPVVCHLFAVPFAFAGTLMLIPRPATAGRKKSRAWIPDALLTLTLIAALLC